VCRLKKALYGLKHAPRAWNARIDGYQMSLGFSKSVADPNLYYNTVNGPWYDALLLGTRSVAEN
jgi:hypothetical protein